MMLRSFCEGLTLTNISVQLSCGNKLLLEIFQLRMNGEVQLTCKQRTLKAGQHFHSVLGVVFSVALFSASSLAKSPDILLPSVVIKSAMPFLPSSPTEAVAVTDGITL